MEFKKLIRPMIIGASLSTLVLLSYHQSLLDIPELKSLDFRFQVRGPIASKIPIVLVSIDQDSFDELQLPFPWPRTLHASLIRKLAAGIYTYLPLGLRVIRKIEAIVREEMNRAGAQEVLMPIASPAE